MVIRASSVVRLSRHWRTSSGSARCLSSASTRTSNSNSSNSNNESGSFAKNLWLGAFAAAAATGTTVLANNNNNKTNCEQNWGDLPSFGSSSDSMAGGDVKEDETEETVQISKIPHSRTPQELSDLLDRKEELKDLIKHNENVVLSTSAAAADPAATATEKQNSFVSTKKMYFYRTSEIKAKKKSKFMLLAGPSSDSLGGDIAHLLGWDLNKMDVGKFNDGETRCEIGESVRGKHVYLICSTSSTDAVMELVFMISALRRSSVKSITAVIPYFGYSRQDQMFGQTAIAASDVAIMYEEMGVDHVMCMDLHNDSIRGFFSPKIPVENLMPVPVAAAYFNEEFGATEDKITVVASHEGQVTRAAIFQNVLKQLSGKDIELAFITKNRLHRGQTKYTPEVVGNVKGRKCIIVDDLVNTGKTLESNVEKLADLGAHSIHSWATHGVFGPASSASTSGSLDRISNMKHLDYLLISNSVKYEGDLPSKIRQLNIAPLLAEAIARSFHNESVSGILNLDETMQERYDSR